VLDNLIDLGGTLVKLGFFVAITAAALRMTVIQVHTVEDNSMAPTLVMGDTVAVWTVGTIDFADVVLCEDPTDDRFDFIGRVVALEGSTIKGQGSQLLIDGDKTEAYQLDTINFYDEDRARHQTMKIHEETFAGNHPHPIFIEQGEHVRFSPAYVNEGVFLLGDNRTDYGHDSRTMGEVDPRDCTGQVILRLKPAEARDDDLDGSYLDIIY